MKTLIYVNLDHSFIYLLVNFTAVFQYPSKPIGSTNFYNEAVISEGFGFLLVLADHPRRTELLPGYFPVLKCRDFRCRMHSPTAAISPHTSFQMALFLQMSVHMQGTTGASSTWFFPIPQNENHGRRQIISA